MTLIVKRLQNGKRGRTLQGCVMDAWNKRQSLLRTIDEQERKLSA